MKYVNKKEKSRNACLQNDQGIKFENRGVPKRIKYGESKKIFFPF